jgi:hypothetical protein
MADRPNYTPFSIVTRLFFGLLTIAMLGGLFVDLIAAQRADWHAQAVAIGEAATIRYLSALKVFEGVK